MNFSEKASKPAKPVGEEDGIAHSDQSFVVRFDSWFFEHLSYKYSTGSSGTADDKGVFLRGFGHFVRYLLGVSLQLENMLTCGRPYTTFRSGKGTMNFPPWSK